MEHSLPPPYPDNRFLINEGELQLQRLAAIVVAIEVLPYNLHCSPTEANKLAENYPVNWCLNIHGWKIVENLSVPKKVQDLVHDPVELISSEIDTWLEYHIPEVFIEWHKKRGDFVLKFIRHFVWTSFGTIDYVKTAEKWIADNDLGISLQQKYRLACLNCLENTIENLYNENPKLADAETGFPLVDYWNFRMAGGELDDIDVIASSAAPYVPIWTHFLEQMNEEQRYQFSIRKMLKLPARVVKELLPKFTEIEQRCLFDEKLTELMKLFVVQSYPEFAIQLWRYMNDTLDAIMYLDVFDELRCIEECFGDDGAPDWLGDLGMEMWRCVSDNLKEKLFHYYKNGYFLYQWTSWFNYELHHNDYRDDTFLLEMLSDLSSNSRKQFWMTNWEDLVDCSKSKYFAKLIEICLPEPDDVDKFLKKLANSSNLQEHLERLCHGDSKFFECTEFLDQFVRNTKLKADLKKSLIPSYYILSEGMNEADFDALSALLIDVHGTEFALKYKAKFIRFGFIECISDPDRQLWRAWRGSAPGKMEPMGLTKHQSFVRDAESFCGEEQLQIIKEKLLAERDFFQTLAEEKENMIVWDDMLKWLIGGKQAMAEDSSLLDSFRNRSKL